MHDRDLPVIANLFEHSRVQPHDVRIAAHDRVREGRPCRVGGVSDTDVRYTEGSGRRLVELEPDETQDGTLAVHDVAVFVQPDNVVGKMLFKIPQFMVVVSGDACLDELRPRLLSERRYRGKGCCDQKRNGE